MAQARASKDRTAIMVSKVAATVNLVDVRFLSFSATHDPIVAGGPMVAQFKFRARTKAEGANDPTIIVLTELLMEARPEGDETGKLCCEIKAQVALTYHTKHEGEFDQAQLDAFGRTNGIFNAWPYWREFVQSSTTRMGLPALVVPSFKMGQLDSPDK